MCRFFHQFQITLVKSQKKNKRTCRLVNHFIGNSCSHTLSDLKFILIEQVAAKTEKFFEHSEEYWQAQLLTYEPYGFNAKKNPIRGDVANFSVDSSIRTHFADACSVVMEIKL